MEAKTLIIPGSESKRKTESVDLLLSCAWEALARWKELFYNQQGLVCSPENEFISCRPNGPTRYDDSFHKELGIQLYLDPGR